MSKLPALQAAVRALEGVAGARVRWPEPHGPAVLHVEFADDADRTEVTKKTLETMREVGGVDLASLQVGASAVTPETAARTDRPVFAGLSVQRSDLDASITVTLAYAGQTSSGTVEGMATRGAAPHMAAAAALSAVREFLPGRMRIHLEWLEVMASTAPGRPEVVHAAVTTLTASGEHTYVGTATVQGDLREAAVRATLDALNRRLQRFESAPAPSMPQS